MDGMPCILLACRSAGVRGSGTSSRILAASTSPAQRYLIYPSLSSIDPYHTTFDCSNMHFELDEVDVDADFDALITCEWESYETPHQTFFRLFCPIIGSGPNARAESIRESTSRQLDWHRSDPTSYWQKVTDRETGKIVAGALWKICETNPFEQQDTHPEAYWFPEGGQREFVNKALEQFDAPRAKLAPRPQLCMSIFRIHLCSLLSRYLKLMSHVVLNIIFTHPDYRREGAGDLILEWGIRKADQMGVEMWLDATVYGVPLYKKHGFEVINENKLHPETENPDDQWRKIEHELMPITLWQMWRPIGGKHEGTKTV